MSTKLSTQTLLERWEDRRECQNLAGKLSHSYVIKQEHLIYERLWSRRGDVCMGLNDGWYKGADAVKGWYDALRDKNILCSRLIKDYFPEELGDVSYEEALGVGLLGYKPVDTCVVEVASDGQTAKGLWVCRGGYMDLESVGFVYKVEWSYLAIDFILEDGQWKIWHLQNLYDVDAPIGDGWSKPRVEWEEEPAFAELRDFKMPEPNVPSVLREYYHPMRRFAPSPRVPEPYDTFAETFSYGIE